MTIQDKFNEEPISLLKFYTDFFSSLTQKQHWLEDKICIMHYI